MSGSGTHLKITIIILNYVRNSIADFRDRSCAEPRLAGRVSCRGKQLTEEMPASHARSAGRSVLKSSFTWSMCCRNFTCCKMMMRKRTLACSAVQARHGRSTIARVMSASSRLRWGITSRTPAKRNCALRLSGQTNSLWSWEDENPERSRVIIDDAVLRRMRTHQPRDAAGVGTLIQRKVTPRSTIRNSSFRLASASIAPFLLHQKHTRNEKQEPGAPP